MSANENKRQWIAGLIIVVTSFVFFQIFYPYHLFFKEQIQLFLNTPDYFYLYFQKPAWLACYTGDYLTQFFYLRGGGATVITLLLLVEWMITNRIIKQISHSQNAHLWAIIPVSIDLTNHCNLLYGSQVTIGINISLMLFLVSRIFTKQWQQAGFGVLFICVGYWALGSPIIIFPILYLIESWFRKKNLYISSSLILFLTLLPVILRRFYLLTIEQAFTYPSMDKSINMVIFALVAITLLSLVVTQRYEKQHQRTVPFLLVFSAIIICGLSMYTSTDFERERILALDSETYFGNNEKVLSISNKYKDENRYITYFTNLALSRQGMLGDSLLSVYQPAYTGLILPVNQNESWISMIFSNEMFYQVGDMNMAQHSAMLANTFSPYHRSSRMIKRLAEINLVNGDVKAANKYLQLLMKTKFHNKWAIKQLLLLESNKVNNKIAEKQKLLPPRDTLIKSHEYIASLDFLVKENPLNKAALNYLLCYHLLTKDIESFSKAYDLYGKNQFATIPKTYEEALLIYFVLHKSSTQEVNNYHINRRTVTRFIEYNNMYNTGKDDLSQMQNKYGDSYWFYYHYAKFEEK